MDNMSKCRKEINGLFNGNKAFKTIAIIVWIVITIILIFYKPNVYSITLDVLVFIYIMSNQLESVTLPWGIKIEFNTSRILKEYLNYKSDIEKIVNEYQKKEKELTTDIIGKDSDDKKKRREEIINFSKTRYDIVWNVLKKNHITALLLFKEYIEYLIDEVMKIIFPDWIGFKLELSKICSPLSHALDMMLQNDVISSIDYGYLRMILNICRDVERGNLTLSYNDVIFYISSLPENFWEHIIKHAQNLEGK